MAAALFAIAVTPALVSPAHACSCATPSDIQAWLDESEAAFVGTLLEKRDAGNGPFGQESIYVFEVEKWVKGDAGDVVEVRSASDGAACGFEFWTPDQRIGAVVHHEDGFLHGGLCSQIDPDVLLVAGAGPPPSKTGIGHLIAGNGWSSARLSILDQVGAHITDITPQSPEVDWDGTQGLEACPGGDLMIQWTQTHVFVWDLTTFELLKSHEIAGPDGYPVLRDASCRSVDASSIWVVGAHEFEAELMEIGDETRRLMSLEGDQFGIGSDFVVVQPHHEGDVTWVDMATGDEVRLTETPPDALRSIWAAAHPSERLVALVETRFEGEGQVEATLSIVDDSGTPTAQFEIPWETYSPTWLDQSRVVVTAYDFNDWERSFGLIVDLATGEMTEVEGWRAEHTISDGDLLYGVEGGSILTTDVSDGVVETLVTLPTQSAGPLLLLTGAPKVAPATTTTTPPGADTEPITPPLVVVGLGEDATGPAGAYQWIAGGAMVVFLALLIWLALGPRDEEA